MSTRDMDRMPDEPDPMKDLDTLLGEESTVWNSPDTLTIVGKNSGREETLNWKHLERMINVVLRLAPPELRQPPEFLDELYEMKRKLKELYELESTQLAEVDLGEIQGEELHRAGAPRIIPGGNPFEDERIGEEGNQDRSDVGGPEEDVGYGPGEASGEDQVPSEDSEQRELGL